MSRILMLLVLALASPSAAFELREVPATTFRSILAEPGDGETAVGGFRLADVPVTNGELAAFVAEHPEWRRDRIARLFADDDYLSHWADALTPEPGTEREPATRVSWFVAREFCAAHGLRLPSWHEWEVAAAADATRKDARDDPAWRQRILDWYARPSGTELPDVGSTEANAYGVRDLHGVVWEWVDDFDALLVASDARRSGGGEGSEFCGGGAIAFERPEDYAVMMRIAMMSALRGASTTRNLGFRCAGDAEASP